MSELTKEWLLKTIAELEEERDATPGAVKEDATMALAAMKLALASLEARSRKLFNCSECGAEGLDEPLESKCHCNEDGVHWIESVVYTAPPAPVADLLLSELLGIAKRAADEADECAHAEFSDDSMEYSAAIADWERRATRLQGADGNPPQSPESWVACSERMPGEVLAALQNIARLRRNLNDFCGDKSLIAKCLSEAEGALLNAVNRHSTMLAEPLKEAKNV